MSVMETLRPFDIREAKEGAKVCTADGREVRILCFDFRGRHPIVAIVPAQVGPDRLVLYSVGGCPKCSRYVGDYLRMLPAEKSGFLNVYKDKKSGVLSFSGPYATREAAEDVAKDSEAGVYVCTSIFSWKE